MENKVKAWAVVAEGKIDRFLTEYDALSHKVDFYAIVGTEQEARKLNSETQGIIVRCEITYTQ